VEERKFDGGIESLVVCHRKIKKRERERNMVDKGKVNKRT